MSKLKDTLIELEISNEQLRDKDIQKFIYDFINRKLRGDWIQYKNGNAWVEINVKDGTSIRTILTDEEYKPEFPENIDMNISNKCTNNCSFCYQGCTCNGQEANIKKYLEDKNSFLYTLHEGTELACLAGDTIVHTPDGAKFIKELKIGDQIFDKDNLIQTIININITQKSALNLKITKNFNVVSSYDHPFLSREKLIYAKDCLNKELDIMPSIIDFGNNGKEEVLDMSKYIKQKVQKKVL